MGFQATRSLLDSDGRLLVSKMILDLERVPVLQEVQHDKDLSIEPLVHVEIFLILHLRSIHQVDHHWSQLKITTSARQMLASSTAPEMHSGQQSYGCF